jgi:hypothetical protein
MSTVPRKRAAGTKVGQRPEAPRVAKAFNYLDQRCGDATNAILAAIGYNYSLLLRWLRLFAQDPRRPTRRAPRARRRLNSRSSRSTM